jgi:SdpI/YfhL protein family
MKTSISVAVGFLIVGLIFILTSIPLRLGKIPPNGLYGIRIRKAFESTELWYRVNAAGGMILYGALILLVGAVLFFVSTRAPVDFNFATIGLVVLITASFFHVLLAWNRIQ